jgi:hypothetical protein
MLVTGTLARDTSAAGPAVAGVAKPTVHPMRSVTPATRDQGLLAIDETMT